VHSCKQSQLHQYAGESFKYQHQEISLSGTYSSDAYYLDDLSGKSGPKGYPESGPTIWRSPNDKLIVEPTSLGIIKFAISTGKREDGEKGWQKSSTIMVQDQTYGNVKVVRLPTQWPPQWRCALALECSLKKGTVLSQANHFQKLHAALCKLTECSASSWHRESTSHHWHVTGRHRA
jgi:hypothetical protein